LIEKGADVHNVDSEGRTVLHAACYGGEEEIIGQLLYVYNLDNEQEDNKGKTAIDYAVKSGKAYAWNLLNSEKDVRGLLRLL
jgi:ankyrin repeat protein